ncbi:MAG: MoxR family ATPase [bacterium]|nr:MoxR family ATPase [bacterium]
MKIEEIQTVYQSIKRELTKVIKGQETVIDDVLISFFAGGHVLIEGVPGLGKTLLVNALSRVVGGKSKRIQFTPDLMPSDIIGTTVYNMKANIFQVKQGPVFTDLLLADEINRSPAKTQSALLQAMQEREVTIDGNDFPLGDFFMCLATQNPIELEGTFPLPEAQVDRFLMKINITYPSRPHENEILKSYRDGVLSGKSSELDLQQVVDEKKFMEVKEAISQIYIDDKIISYITEIVHATRSYPGIEVGASPRGSVALLQTSRVKAAVEGRDFIVPDDIKYLALPVLRHRIIPEPETEIEGFTADDFLKKIIESVQVPR